MYRLLYDLNYIYCNARAYIVLKHCNLIQKILRTKSNEIYEMILLKLFLSIFYDTKALCGIDITLEISLFLLQACSSCCLTKQ